jgi:hypothetical protein
MKKTLLILFLLSSQVVANQPIDNFYEPNISNNYQGRLLSLNVSYPIEKMKKLCEPFTGIDTAQIKCRKQATKNTFICEYKCSLHWMTDKK